jgi:NhaP-type Na+/H+ or K+/H+ antiporter
VTTNQILIGVGLILVLAVGSQVLASQLRIPALIVLLPVGFAAGALTTDVNPERLLGPAFEPLVSLSVAVILYDAGLGLDLRKLTGHTRRVVVRNAGAVTTGDTASPAAADEVAGPPGGLERP